MTEARPEQPPPHDGGLVARCRAGDQAAWGELVEQYSRYVYAIAVRGFRLSEADAEDVFQDTFLRVYERLGTLRDDEAIRPWIAQVARRLCLDRVASAGRTVPGGGEPEIADGGLEDIEQAMDVREGLASLDETCRELLDRFFARDEPYRVIADELSLPMGTVASRISRCLAKLRGALAEGRNPAARESGE
jgi:RNA polymerase sigma factor (sigma-70 family)